MIILFAIAALLIVVFYSLPGIEELLMFLTAIEGVRDEVQDGRVFPVVVLSAYVGLAEYFVKVTIGGEE